MADGSWVLEVCALSLTQSEIGTLPKNLLSPRLLKKVQMQGGARKAE